MLPALSLSITALVVDSVVQAIRTQNASSIWWPVGLQLDVQESAQLSGGEWQKVALVRAFMREAHILVLDEPARDR